MKFKYTPFILVLIALAFGAFAQENRTTETRVADVLALLPAQTDADADRLFKDLASLPDAGLDLVTSRVLPNGKQEGVAARFAVSLLTHHSASRSEKERIESAYLRALARANNTEVKAYFIDNLKLIGSDASVPALAEKITEEGLADQAISALVSIGTTKARAALVTALEKNATPGATARLIQSIGELKHQPAADLVKKYASSDDNVIRRHALWSLALIADEASYNDLLLRAKNVGFKNDPTEATHALVEYIHQSSAKGNKAVALRASQELLSNTLEVGQEHFRLSALRTLATLQSEEAPKTLIKELNRFDAKYQREVLNIASAGLKSDVVQRQWMKLYKKNSTLKAEILSMVAAHQRNDKFIDDVLVPALSAKYPEVRIAAAEQIAYSDNKKYITPVVDYLAKSTDAAEISAAKGALLRLVSAEDAGALAGKVSSASSAARAALIEILGAKRATSHFNVVLDNTSSTDPVVKKAAFDALANVSSSSNTAALLTLLGKAGSNEEVASVRAALIASLDKSGHSLVNDAYAQNKARILPILPYVNDGDALKKVTEAFYGGNAEERAAAFDALLNWQNHSAARTILAIRKDAGLKQYHEKAFQAFVGQVGKSDLPDDQKRLMFEEAMSLATTTQEKTLVIRAVGNLRSFLALTFVAQYLDDKDLSRAASRSVMQIALPTADARPGLTGAFVRSTLQKILDKLEGQDSQYEVIDIQTYLANMPYTRGFEPIFNGQDLSGWQGLVENPIARAKMTKAELAKKQAEANKKMAENWTVKDGAIWFSGKGANLCTVRPYGDFEMLVDWKISRDGDSGIYLRGSPQVQIWDPWGKLEAARVGSGGLYNNQKNPSEPLVIADNPVGEWNTFHIKMVGDRVTVHLNGVLVVDNVVMENYWDRGIPIFPEEAIELQAHGNELAFKNIYVKELGGKPYELTPAEVKEGFELLFNGKDLENWLGNKTEYVVEDNTIAIYPKGRGHGNLYTEKEYSDFVFRFEFQLTPGANNGLGIHAPLNGDAAYGGKEIQILDDTAPVYATLQQYQYHGSVYGVVPAKRGYLKPVGEWNEEEVYVKGDRIKVTLNGTVILDADLKKAAKNGTLDKKDHPGLKRYTGHIGFLGHGTVVRFRNIRVKDLSTTKP